MIYLLAKLGVISHGPRRSSTFFVGPLCFIGGGGTTLYVDTQYTHTDTLGMVINL